MSDNDFSSCARQRTTACSLKTRKNVTCLCSLDRKTLTEKWRNKNLPEKDKSSDETVGSSENEEVSGV